AMIGLAEPGLDRLIRAGYTLLDLVTFFTAGPKEAKAWTVKRGARAPQAAGGIHTDFERGFIRAETIAYDDYVTYGGEAGARHVGKMRLEGRHHGELSDSVGAIVRAAGHGDRPRARDRARRRRLLPCRRECGLWPAGRCVVRRRARRQHPASARLGAGRARLCGTALAACARHL